MRSKYTSCLGIVDIEYHIFMTKRKRLLIHLYANIEIVSQGQQ